MPSVRYDRLNEEVKKVLSEIVREMKDPRISTMTTIMLAEVTNDLKQAKVRVSVYDEDEKVRAGSVEALNHAGGFISRELGKRMEIRRVPQLKFVLDDSIAYSVHISQVLNQLNYSENKDEAED